MYLQYQLLESLKRKFKKDGDIENKKNNRQKKVNEIQNRLSNEGGYFVKEKDRLLKRKAVIEFEIQQQYEQVQELFRFSSFCFYSAILCFTEIDK